MSNPGFFFYTGDWIKDTRCLSLQARGAWIDLLCLLNEHGGELTWPWDAFASYLGIMSDECKVIVRSLSALGHANVTEKSDGSVTLVSRRMLRDRIKRENTRLRQEKARAYARRSRMRHRGGVTPMSHESSAPLLNPSPSLNSKEKLKQKESGLQIRIKRFNGSDQTEDVLKVEDLEREKELKRLMQEAGFRDEGESEKEEGSFTVKRSKAEGE